VVKTKRLYVMLYVHSLCSSQFELIATYVKLGHDHFHTHTHTHTHSNLLFIIAQSLKFLQPQ